MQHITCSTSKSLSTLMCVLTFSHPYCATASSMRLFIGKGQQISKCLCLKMLFIVDSSSPNPLEYCAGKTKGKKCEKQTLTPHLGHKC